MEFKNHDLTESCDCPGIRYEETPLKDEDLMFIIEVS